MKKEQKIMIIMKKIEFFKVEVLCFFNFIKFKTNKILLYITQKSQ